LRVPEKVFIFFIMISLHQALASLAHASLLLAGLLRVRAR
jgi:hypothetical protein